MLVPFVVAFARRPVERAIARHRPDTGATRAFRLTGGDFGSPRQPQPTVEAGAPISRRLGPTRNYHIWRSSSADAGYEASS
jgi:hypothetical protein